MMRPLTSVGLFELTDLNSAKLGNDYGQIYNTIEQLHIMPF